MFSEILKETDEFTVNTGNLNSWKELKSRSFVSPSEELTECIRLLKKPGNFHAAPSPENNDGRTQNFYSQHYLTEEKILDRYSRDELKITLKIFLAHPNAEYIKRCLFEVKKELQVNYIDLLILALSSTDADYSGVAPSLSTKVLTIWPTVEKLVADGHVAALGCADLDADDLRRIWEGAKSVKPLVNHYYLSSCCSVPPELKEYAKQRDVILFTHNDPNPFLSDQQVADVLDDNDGRWSLEWVAKYVAMIKSRSVIAGKGYLANFKLRK